MHILKLGEDEPSSTRQGASKEEPGIDDTNMMVSKVWLCLNTIRKSAVKRRLKGRLKVAG